MRERLGAVLPWLAAFFLPLAVYLPTLGYGFVFDDQPLIVNNPALQAPVPPAAYFARDIDALRLDTDAASSNYYRPLLMILLRAGKEVCGNDPRAWHLVVAGLHALTGLLALAFLLRCGFDRTGSLLASLAFSLHPVHVDSAAWVSGIQDVWLGVTALLAAIACQACREGPSPWRLPVLAAAYVAALLSKETALGLLLFAAADTYRAHRDGAPDARRAARALAVLAVLTGAYLVVRFQVLGAFARPLPSSPALPIALASVPHVVLTYLRMVLLPFDLALLSPVRPVAAWLGAPSLAAGAALLAVLAGAAFLARRQPAATAPLLWFAAWLAPCLSLWNLNREWIVMDRYLYLPVLALPWLVLAVVRGRVRLGLLAALGLAYAGLTLVQMRVFRDERVFWARMAEADPGSSTAQAERGRLLLEAGQRTEARAALERAVQLSPDNLLPALRLASLELAEGRATTAAEAYRRLTERSPGYAPAWRNLPVALHQAGRVPEALATAREAVARFPRDVEARVTLATILRGLGSREEALATLAPVRGDARAALRTALLLAELGRRHDALEAVRAARPLSSERGFQAQLDGLEAGLR
ncbi:MAG: tetratricopeptide repeat protein [Vicinamibacteria bacterium]